MKMAYLVGLMGLTLASTQAQALHYFNCSSADGSVKVVEHEIWGANPTGCYFQGKAVVNGKLVIDKDTKEYFNETANASLRDYEYDFVAHAVLSSTKGQLKKGVKEVKTFLLCHEKSTSAMDLVAPSTNCDVSEE